MIGFGHLAMAAALATAVAGFGGYLHGIGVGVDRERSTQLRVEMAAEQERKKLQGDLDASGQAHQSAEYARQSSVREIFHESQKVIERPVYRNVCVDADGVRLLDGAANVANGKGVAAPSGTATGAAEDAANRDGRDGGRPVPGGGAVTL